MIVGTHVASFLIWLKNCSPDPASLTVGSLYHDLTGMQSQGA
jgi:hypothetical protein